MNRREFLFGAFGAGATAILPELAFAEKKDSDIADPHVDLVHSLATPRIDHTLSPEDLDNFSNLAEFKVAQVSVALRNRISLETVRLLYGADGNFAWHWEMAPGGEVPFIHKHVDEEETIKLMRGKLSCILEGLDEPVTADARLAPVDFVIPRDTFHLPFNDQ